MTNINRVRKPRVSVKTAAPVKTVKVKAAAPAKKLAGAKPLAAAPAPTPAQSAKVKHKLVRDSFTIPKSEYAVLEALKQRATNLARPTKKSELLRAGIGALNAMADKAFLAALTGVPSLKTGRPKGSAPAAKKASAK